MKLISCIGQGTLKTHPKKSKTRFAVTQNMVWGAWTYRLRFSCHGLSWRERWFLETKTQFAVTQNMSSEKKDTFCGDAKYGLRSMDYRLRFSCHGLSWRERWFLETKTQFAVTQNMSSEKKDTFCGDAKYGLRKELTLSGVCHAPARTAQRVGLGQGGDLAPSALFILRTKI